MDSTSPARPVIGLLLPVLGVDTALFQVVFQAILKAFSLPPLFTSPIGQFAVQDLLWESGRRCTDKGVTGPMKLVLEKIGQRQR